MISNVAFSVRDYILIKLYLSLGEKISDQRNLSQKVYSGLQIQGDTVCLLGKPWQEKYKVEDNVA